MDGYPEDDLFVVGRNRVVCVQVFKIPYCAEGSGHCDGPFAAFVISARNIVPRAT